MCTRTLKARYKWDLSVFPASYYRLAWSTLSPEGAKTSLGLFLRSGLCCYCALPPQWHEHTKPEINWSCVVHPCTRPSFVELRSAIPRELLGFCSFQGPWNCNFLAWKCKQNFAKQARKEADRFHWSIIFTCVFFMLSLLLYFYQISALFNRQKGRAITVVAWLYAL